MCGEEGVKSVHSDQKRGDQPNFIILARTDRFAWF